MRTAGVDRRPTSALHCAATHPTEGNQSMSIPSNCVSIHPYFKAHPGQLDAVKASLPSFIAKTATEKNNLYYDFTLNGDLLFCREAYLDAEALQAHLTSIGPMLQEFLKIADLTRLEIHGPAAELEKLKASFAPFNPT
jgi:quinol monooxygenase YgiN